MSRINFHSLLGLLVIIGLQSHSRAYASDQSVYDRVMQSNEIRCGYAVWPGLVEKDPNTGKLSGAFYDYMNALGESLQLKVTWAHEVSFGTIVEELRTSKVDAVCSGAWTNAIRGKFVDFTTPISFQQVWAFSRADEKRFKDSLSEINSPNFTISVVDGESAATIAATDFPLAKVLSMPAGSEMSQMLLNVIHGKADLTFADIGLAGDFIEKNPGKLKRLNLKFPVRVYGNPIAISKGESALKEMLDTATRQLLWTGAIDKILTKHERYPGMFIRVKLPFEMPQE